ncbi:hypothetical protein DUK53_14555 [Listeria sp. SHR_NRA_18]|uniref:hypothetical protein n=1 Tax=Listeria sp. SHR_NRA_18 TaxID=2269046 RepID=UPI000F5E7735|nr:hypothetical protein [Listeria sp. SHR_NRA_18]RQW65832.1 hypothetical protein DUK53_14555 [Listeria sp. SHR_NRA_18]
MEKYTKIETLLEEAKKCIAAFEDGTDGYRSKVNDVTISEFLKGESMIDIGQNIAFSETVNHYEQYYTNGKVLVHVFENNKCEELLLFQDAKETILELSIKKIKQAIELQKQIEDE